MKEQEPVCEDSGHEVIRSCHKLLAALGDFVDGTIDPELCADLERHMENCERCRVVVDTLRKTVELYQETAADTQMPSDVRERLYARLNLEDYLK